MGTKPLVVPDRVTAVEYYAVGLNASVEVDAFDPLEVLFRAHYSRLVRTLTLVSGSSEAAADAVQEAFVRAHLHWWRIKRYDDPVAWIRRVAINRLRDDHRRSVREERAVARLASQVSTDSSTMAQPQESVGSADNDMRGRVAELPRQQRLAVTLFYVDELSVAEVAAAMSLSVGTVKFHLHQGRERLRSALPASESEVRDEL